MNSENYQRQRLRLSSLPDLIEEDDVPITEQAMDVAKQLLDWCSEREIDYLFLISNMLDEGGVRFEWDKNEWLWSIDVEESGKCRLHGCTREGTEVTKLYKQDQFELMFKLVEFVSVFHEM